jgi:hypothetical protein
MLMMLTAIYGNKRNPAVVHSGHAQQQSHHSKWRSVEWESVIWADGLGIRKLSVPLARAMGLQ